MRRVAKAPTQSKEFRQAIGLRTPKAPRGSSFKFDHGPKMKMAPAPKMSKIV